MKIVSLLGKGRTSVYLGTINKRPYAVKVLTSEHIDSKEETILLFVRHPNIVRCHGRLPAPLSVRKVEPSAHDVIVLDYIRGIPLDYFRLYPKFGLDLAIPIFSTLLNTVNYIHRLGIAHNDIHTHNILIEYNDVTGWKQKRAILVDFGDAQFIRLPLITPDRDIYDCLLLGHEMFGWIRHRNARPYLHLFDRLLKHPPTLLSLIDQFHSIDRKRAKL